MPMKPFTAIRKEFEHWFKRQEKAGWESPEIERAATRLRCALWERAHNSKASPSQAKIFAELLDELAKIH